MITAMKPERVLVNTNGQRAVGQTTHQLFITKLRPRGGDQPPEEIQGDFIGFGVRLDSGHEIYAQMEQMTPIEGPPAEIVEAETEAAKALSEMRGISYEERLA